MTRKSLAHYDVQEKIGQGGMGEVYLARVSKLGRDVALKFLPEPFASDPERLARFQREARTLASLHHPNIATLFGLEEVDGQRFLVMELATPETEGADFFRSPRTAGRCWPGTPRPSRWGARRWIWSPRGPGRSSGKAENSHAVFG
jgi:serine/threonine protein kinase